MSWLISLFTSSNQKDRRGQAITSTHEAFSLPTSSPILPQHADSFTSEPLGMDATNDSYSYPPKGGAPGGGGRYGYLPTSGGSRSRPASLLPLHRDSMNTLLSDQPPYPPLEQTWNRLKTWLTREYPELGDTLNWGILPQDLSQIEMQFGFLLPPAVRESYLAVDGQEAESAAGCNDGLFFGLTLLPLEDVLEEWRFWREVDDDPATGANQHLRQSMESIPPGWIRLEYSQRGWIPLIADKAGNYVGVDLNPAEGGSVGQVIVFGRDFDTKVVLWKGDGPGGWAHWLAAFVDELESGEGFEIGHQEASEGSEDELGYESYFYDGTGRGQGDGGGDTGQGGIRLGGEYKGWNVFEAWADKSLRKWHEAGAIPENITAQEKGKNVSNVGLGVIDLTKDKSAEVPIPLLTEVDEEAPPVPAKTPLPTISITKPPAPLPVALPSPRDISTLPSPPESPSSFDEDLESGRSKGMRRGTSDVPYLSRKSKPKAPTLDTETPGDLDPMPVTPHSSTPLINKGRELPPGSPVNELYSNSGSVLDSAATQPSLPSLANLTKTVEDEDAEALVNLEEPKKVEEGKDEEDEDEEEEDDDEEEEDDDEEDGDEEEDDEEEESVEENTTVRLVGGGGNAGTSEAPQPEDEEDEDEDDDTASLHSSSSNPASGSNADGKKRHHKAGLSSLSNLKLALGGKRKKESVSSLKETK